MPIALIVLAGCTPPGLPAPLAPTVTSAAATVTVPPTSVTIGIDGAAPGFNPHAIADFSPVTTAIASLVLPSVSVYAADGTLTFDRALVDSASVTSADPFTVTYVLDRNAAWSDGTPVTGEDFGYLAAQMSSAAGTVDPAGYRLIRDVRSREGGKVVDVVFSAPFADWRTLFADLLPAHLLKDAPGGWSAALNTGIPVSANRYKVVSVDRTTGEITLQRNDKYWAGVSGPATVVVRMGDSPDLLAALERGDLEAVQIRPSAAEQPTVDAIPPDRRVRVPEPGTVQLVMNTGAGPTVDPAIRRAVVAALGQETVIAALGGAPAAQPQSDGSGSEVPVSSMISLPSTTVGRAAVGGNGTAPDPSAAGAELASAGYTSSGVYVTKEGRPLAMRLGYPAADARLAAAARVVQAELGKAGIQVDLVADGIQPLVAAVVTGSLDLALVSVGRGSNDGVAAASAYGCPDATAPPASARGGNLSGYCSSTVQPILERALVSGHEPEAAEAPLVADRPVWPIAQPVDTVVVSPALREVVSGAGPGWIFSGPFAGVATWPLS